MKILKILYICWIVLLVFTWFLSPYITHNPDRLEEFFITIGLIIFPPMVVNLWLLGITGIKKYLKMFLILFLYYPLAFILFLFLVKFIGS